ncbi:hypothetical protein LEA_06984 [human gut metagenome]|uniref:Uncharacterized protein n=1 Tax=human gut metagenome TaxID=408170 RepID=K1TWI5_9ZZZZ
MPSTILYHPKIWKSCFLIYPIRNFITRIETRNATTVPITKTVSSVTENASPNFIILRKLNPNITGTARKNVNSAAATLETPINNAPIIVEPEREVPGIIDKI